MKKLTILLFSILISFSSYGKWMKFVENNTGDTHYLEMNTVKEHGGYVYYWDLIDYLKPSRSGMMSAKVYHQGDCGISRYKALSFFSYKQPMGGGSGKTSPPSPEWRYLSPDSNGGVKLKWVCDHVKLLNLLVP
jgi:hypothetical protein